MALSNVAAGLAGLLLTVFPLQARPQSTQRSEASVAAVLGLPLTETLVPGVLLRAGLIQESDVKRYSARVSLEAILNPTVIWSSADTFPYRALVGVGYDVRFHDLARPAKSYIVVGTGLHRAIGIGGDSYPFWLLSPRIGFGGEIGGERGVVAWEVSAQYAGLTNFGGLSAGVRRFSLPVGISVQFE